MLMQMKKDFSMSGAIIARDGTIMESLKGIESNIVIA